MKPAECEDCIFWQASGYEDNWGECRRSAPLAYRTPEPGNVAYRKFPTTGAGDWCGEFKKRLKKRASK